MKKWQVGKFTITEIQEFAVAVGLLDGIIAEATPDVVRGIDWLHPDYADDAGKTLWDVHAYVIDTGDQVVLVDPGCGNGKSMPLQPTWGGLDTPFLERLAAAGYERDDIDVILSTHLHLDHIGWATMRDERGEWVPTFPNARMFVVEEEYEFHKELMNAPDDVETWPVAFEGSDPSVSRQTRLLWKETIQPMVDAGMLELVPGNAEVVPGIRYERTAGHTLGHHSLRLSSDGRSAFITGDFIHHPLQIARPDWSSGGDWDGQTSARSRREFFAKAAGTDLLVLGTHFAGAGAGYIVEDGDGFRLSTSAPA